MKLALPDWCSQADYQKLVEVVDIYINAGLHTYFMKRLVFGPLMEEFIKNIQDSETKISTRKIYLYSGHDFNIASFERVFNLTNVPKVPDYGSALMIEKLRGRDNRTYIRVRSTVNNVKVKVLTILLMEKFYFAVTAVCRRYKQVDTSEIGEL